METSKKTQAWTVGAPEVVGGNRGSNEWTAIFAPLADMPPAETGSLAKGYPHAVIQVPTGSRKDVAGAVSRINRGLMKANGKKVFRAYLMPDSEKTGKVVVTKGHRPTA